MSAQVIPFDFEEQAVRVLMRGDDPWFVAADVCRVLELGNTSQAVSRLDDDERGITTNDTLGGAQRVTVINESGLYALVLTSRKDAAKRFRKWITSEVLPAIRQHGRYELVPAPEAEPGQIAGLPIREAELWLQMVREARLTRGTRAALSIWGRSPLPQIGDTAAVDPREGQAALSHLLAHLRPLIADCRSGIDAAALTEQGLRAEEAGLFVANYALPVFVGTRWAAGAHRAALATLPGVLPVASPRTLASVRTRGVILPWQMIEAEGL